MSRLFICEMTKEDSTWFERNIKKKIRDWKTRHLLAAIFSVYVFLFVLWVVAWILAFSGFRIFNTDADSARYMLSALVQSQAAIVAIVVSLTLIAVQLTASAYSPRVIDIFKSPKKNPDFWILIGFYGVSIFYGLLLLKLVEGAEGDFVNQSAIWPSFHPIISLEHGISFAYWLGAFTFIIIVPYIWNILTLLKPENVIKYLATDITKEHLIHEKIKNSSGKSLEPTEALIQPIMDIVHGAIMKYDIETTRVGLNAVTERVIEIIDSDGEKEISERFCEHLERVGKLAISRNDEESAVEVIEKFEEFGKSTMNKLPQDATLQITASLEEIGKTTAEKRLGDATSQAVKSLGAILTVAIEKSLQVVAIFTAAHHTNIAKAAIKNDLEAAPVKAAMSLRDAGTIAVKRDRNHVPGVAVACLNDVGTAAAAKKGFDLATLMTASGLIILGLATAAKREFEYETEQAAESLAELTVISEENVRTTIQDYESELKGENRKSFQKFIKIYEQKFEELRAEKKNSE